MPWIIFILVTKNTSTANTKELSVERAKMSDYCDSEMPSSKWAPLTLPEFFSFASASTQLTLKKNRQTCFQCWTVTSLEYRDWQNCYISRFITEKADSHFTRNVLFSEFSIVIQVPARKHTSVPLQKWHPQSPTHESPLISTPAFRLGNENEGTRKPLP